MVSRISFFVTRHATLVFSALMLLTLIPAYFAYSGLSLKVILEEMLPADANNVQLFQRFGAEFGGANTTLIEVKNEKGNVYSLEFLERYKEIADEVYYNPNTQRHLSQSLVLRKTKAISGGGGRVEISAVLWPDLPRDEAAMTQFRRTVNSQYRGFLVSDDETSAMIIADFKDDIDFEQTLEFFQGLREKHENRTWIGVFVPMFTATIATIWGLGAMGAANYNLDPLLVLLPAFIFAIVLSHGVQLTTRILDHLSDEDAIPDDCRSISQRGLKSVLVPSTGAIITDAAGFGVLGLVAIPSIQGLAIICGIWLLSIAPALILASATMCLLPPPKSHKTGSVLLNKIWTTVINVEDHKYIVITVAAVCLLGGLSYATNLTVGDTKGSAILWPESRFNADSESVNTRFSFLGSDVMQVYIDGDEGTMLDPSVYHQTEALDRYLYEHMPEVRPAQSLVPIIKLVNSVLYEGDPSYELLPDTKEEIGFDIYMYRSRGEPGDFAAFTNSEWEIGNLSFFLQDHSVPTIAKVRTHINDFFDNPDNIVSDADFLYFGGQVGITEALNEEIMVSNQKIMVAISIVIAICIIFLYRSIAVGLVLITSLATANALTYAFMAWKGVGLNISTLPLAALGVGLGVDYGIYMLDRIKEEYAHCGSVTEAMHRALMTSGNAIVITALTMILPLVPWILFSPLRFQAEMSMLLALVLSMNMLGSLLFVPAALAALRPKAIFPKSIPRSIETKEIA
jgi:predicted RND superfamily exporter protein